jgi:hypothetical protein
MVSDIHCISARKENAADHVTEMIFCTFGKNVVTHTTCKN